MKSVREAVLESIKRVAEQNELTVSPSLNDDTALLDSGLDSLGFAIVVVDLEGVLGLDPFVIMEEPVYPNTLGEFVAIYEKFCDPGMQA